VSATDAPAQREPAWRRLRVGDLAERSALLVAWAATVVAFSIAKPDTFPTSDNFFINIFGTQAVQVVLALALIIPLVAGEYDISVAANLTLAAMIVGVLNVDHGMSIGVAVLVALAVGALIGAINGGLIVLLGIDSFIVTLGTSTFIAGVVLWISDSRTIGGVSQDLVDGIIIDRFLGVPLAFWYALALAAVMFYVLEFTPLGRRLLFVGRGRAVARLSGLHVGRLRWGAMIASGVIAAGAGVIYAGTTGSADPSSGLNFLLPAFSAAFLGATAIQPGRFNPFGAVAAVYFLATGITGLQQLGVDTFIQQLFYGGALVLAVALSQLVRRRRAIELGPAE
jgi:ribose transport system permease protein